jgi:hypothetical protein
MRIPILMTFLLSVLSSQSAAARDIVCKMDVPPDSYYIAQEIRLKLGDFGEVSVKDKIIASTDRNMVAGSVSKENATRISISWEVKNAPADPLERKQNQPHLVVRLTIQKASGVARITVVDSLPRRPDLRSAQGICAFES